MSERIITKDHNIEEILKLGFHKVRNTTVFQKGDNFIISPAVNENTNGRYWIDLREVNLNRINDDAILMVRIVPDLFILKRISDIKELLTSEVMDNRSKSGNVWSIFLEMNNQENTSLLFNRKNPDYKISAGLLDKNALKKEYHELVQFSI